MVKRVRLDTDSGHASLMEWLRITEPAVRKIMPLKKIAILITLFLIVGTYYFFGGSRYLDPSFFQQFYNEQPLLTAGIYFLLYVVITAVSIPGAAVLTLAGGYMFGLAVGTVLVSFASSIGATLAFLVSRALLHDWVQARFASYGKVINRGVERDGPFYLFTLRLIPVIPFFVINLAMGLTKMRVFTFYWVSQIGMLPATIVYVNAGAELGAIGDLSVEGILTPGLWVSFALLAMFPFIARAIVNVIKRRRVYRGHRKPRSFDTNLVVIGAGSAGLVSAYIAAAVKAGVTLIEKHKMGGDCLNTGCVPSKALIRSARLAHEVRRAEDFGVSAGEPEVNFAGVMERIQKVIKSVQPHDSVERYTKLGVDCVFGEAKIVSPWQVEVGDRIITTRSIIIASGASPFVPPIEGLDQIEYLTSDNLWSLRELPPRLLVLGAGPVGCELAQAFQRLGSRVTLVDRMPRLLPREDEEVSVFVRECFEREGIEVLTAHETVGFERREGETVALLKSESGQSTVVFDRVLVAVGRKANTQGFGLEELGVETTSQGTIAVDKYLRTRFPNVYACGDVCGPYQFTHTASYQAWYAAVNALFAGIRAFKVDYSVIPQATFVDPEVARVGLNEREALEQGIDFEVTRYGIDDLDRAIADGTAEGFVKVLTAKGKDKVLGATIVGYHASDLITEFVTAMKHNIGLNRILGTIHIYPTLSEANKFAAGEWKRAHAPEKALRWLRKYHSWRR